MGNSLALVVQEAKSILRGGVPLFCGLAECGDGGLVYAARRCRGLHSAQPEMAIHMSHSTRVVVVHCRDRETCLCAMSVTLFLKQMYAVSTPRGGFYPTEPSLNGARAASGYQTREHRLWTPRLKGFATVLGTDGSML